MSAFTLFPRPILYIVLALLAACGDESSPTPAASAQAPQAFPASLDRTDTLAGLDHNLNGVRDDVEQWINSHDTLSLSAQQALLRYAHIMQQTVLAAAQQPPRALELARQQASAQACLAGQAELKPNAVAWSRRLRQITANTEARVRAHLAYSAALDGRSWSLPLQEDCNAH